MLVFLVLCVVVSVTLVGLVWSLVGSAPMPPPLTDVNPPTVYWSRNETQPGSDLRDAGPIVGLTYRILPAASDPRADRLYVATLNRLYAFDTRPNVGGRNAWFSTFVRYFDVTEGTDPTRTVTAPPLLMNYGDYTYGPADYELYLGTSDGTLFLLRDTGGHVPAGGNETAKLQLDGRITGLAAYTRDDVAPPQIMGTMRHAYYDGTTWTDKSAPAPVDLGLYTSIALNASGIPYFAGYDVTNGRPMVLFQSGGNWTFLPSPEPYSGVVNVGRYTSLAIGSDGQPRLAYYDETGGDLKYAQWTGSQWNVSYVDTAGDVGRYASLKLDTADRPHIAYYNATGRHLGYAVLNGTSWTFDPPNLGSDDTGTYASLALDAAGRPRIAYYDATTRSIWFVARAAGSWLAPEPADPSTDDVGAYASLAVDPVTGQPHIAYYDATVRALKHATKTAGWAADFVDRQAGGDVGQYASLAIGPAGRPAIAYFDATNLDLKYAEWTGTAWQNRTLVSDGNVGLYDSLAFDAIGRPHVGFYSFRTGRTAKDLVVVGTATGKVYGIDVSIPRTIVSLPRAQQVDSWDYRVRWVLAAGAVAHLADVPRTRITIIPACSGALSRDGGLVFVGLSSGELLAVNTSAGSIAWRRTIPGASWGSAPAAYFDAFVSEERVLAGGDEGTLSVFLARTGELLGSQHVASAALRTPAPGAGLAYVATSGGELHALRLGDRASPSFLGEAWSARLSGAGSGAVLVEVANGALYAVDVAGRLHSLQLDGLLRYRVRLCDSITADAGVWVPPMGLGAHLWIGCQDGTVAAVSAA